MLEIKNISKRFSDFGLKEVSFQVRRGDYFILLGESGAGKSVILETISGLVRPDGGTILLNGTDITNARIQHRNIGLVFQDHAVFPHLSVFENIAYPLHGSSLTKEEKRTKVTDIARELGISELLLRKPSTLSGGELQRVALGRTLIQKPSVLLLDEPLASLDARLKSDLRRLLRSIHRGGQTMLHVTHDYEEALALGTRIAVINHGTIVQTGTPSEVFCKPGSEFVAHFVGVKNFFPATLTSQNNTTFATIGNKIPVRIVSDVDKGDGFILIRSEDVILSVDPVITSAVNHFEGRIVEIVPTSRGFEITIDAGFEAHALITEESLENLDLKNRSSCWIHFKATAVRFIPGLPAGN